MSIADKLTYLNETKRQLREAINAALGAGLTESDSFRSYADFLYGLWTPELLFQDAEQGAWYDPSDLSTLFQDAAGATPVTADGDPVGLMLDKSGNGNHAYQATSAARPIYRTGGELHWLDATSPGVFLYLPLTGLFQNALTGEAFLAVNNNLPVRPSGRLLDFSTGVGENSARFVLYSNLGGNHVMTLGTRRLDDDPFSRVDGDGSIGLAVHSMQRNWGSGAGRLRKNSGEWHSSQVLATPGATSDTASRACSLPTRHTAESPEVLVYGLIVRRGIATDSEIKAVETFLANKAGVTLP